MLYDKPVITITGTNGKGSCVAICEAILTAQGYKVGCYTSPHLVHFNERIRIAGRYATDEEITEAYQAIDKNLGYFAQATQAALQLFKTQKLDAYLLEVGIGGRLDPVNLQVDPDVSVITSIDIDHTDRLGMTREAIGFEKAHIFRSFKPAICGEMNVPDSVISYAKKIAAPLFCAQKDYFFEAYKTYWTWWNQQQRYDTLPLPHLYLQNAATALAALSHLPLSLSREAIDTGLKTAFLAGRFQIIEEPVLHILDVAHNPASAHLLAQRLSALPCKGKTIAVVGMLKDKDIQGTLSPLFPLASVWHTATLDDPRTASAQTLQTFISDSLAFASPIFAYQAALEKAAPNDRIVIFGSFRTVGKILEFKKTLR